jgi:hypothetical protein
LKKKKEKLYQLTKLTEDELTAVAGNGKSNLYAMLFCLMLMAFSIPPLFMGFLTDVKEFSWLALVIVIWFYLAILAAFIHSAFHLCFRSMLVIKNGEVSHGTSCLKIPIRETTLNRPFSRIELTRIEVEVNRIGFTQNRTEIRRLYNLTAKSCSNQLPDIRFLEGGEDEDMAKSLQLKLCNFLKISSTYVTKAPYVGLPD